MRSETTRKGEIAKCEVIRRAYERGETVSVPTIDCDYDVIIDDGKKLHRVQVKYANAKSSQASGSIQLCLRRATRRSGALVYTSDDIDAILLYLPVLDVVIWLPPRVWNGRTSITVRYEPSKNGQKRGVTMAADFIW